MVGGHEMGFFLHTVAPPNYQAETQIRLHRIRGTFRLCTRIGD
jgi:hypothetical protein